MKHLTKIFILIHVFIAFYLHAEPISKEILENKIEELKKLDPATRKEKIELLDYETSASILSYLRYKYIKENPRMEIVFSMYDHISNLNAIELSQKRLNRLLIVIVFILLLFSVYLTYILISQNKIIKELKEFKISNTKSSNKNFEVFKG